MAVVTKRALGSPARPEVAVGLRVVSRRPTNVIDFIKYYVYINVNFSWPNADTLDVLSTMQVYPFGRQGCFRAVGMVTPKVVSRMPGK